LIKVLVVDDHDLVRMGLARMLADVKGLSVVGQARTGEEALLNMRFLQPNVVLMDVQMPGIGGVETTRKMAERYPHSKILVVSAHEEEPFLSRILEAGASGYITKGTDLSEMIDAIHKISSGQCYFSADIAAKLAQNWLNRKNQEDSPFDSLSRREMQMAEMVIHGQTNQDIADTMGVAPTTLSTYRARIYEKLEVENDVQLTHLAMRFGMLKKE
jgi:DNA-binding NarL/FixJ family response regulator